MIDFIRIPEARLKYLKRNQNLVKQLEELGGVKVRLDEEVGIETEDPIMLLRAKEVMKAFGRGFLFDDALYLLDESYFLESLDVESYCKSDNRAVVLKARVIGTKGKTKRMIGEYTNTKIAVYGDTVSIIGIWKDVMLARKAVEMLLFGSSHTVVYKFLEQKAVKV